MGEKSHGQYLTILRTDLDAVGKILKFGILPILS